MVERKECGSNMEFDIIEKIIIAAACPVFASSLLVLFYMTQARWEKRRDQRWWATRQAEWIDEETIASKLRGAK